MSYMSVLVAALKLPEISLGLWHNFGAPRRLDGEQWWA
jgi:hypothetical protein